MKKKLAFIVTLFLFLFSIVEAQSVTQTKFRAGYDNLDVYVVDYTFTADSGAYTGYMTNTFTLPDGFNNVNWSSVKVTAFYDLNTASGTPKTIITINGVGPNTSTLVLDSLGVTTGIGDTLVSTTANKCMLDLNGYKSSTYKVGVTQIATGKALTASYVRFIFTKPKNS